MVPESPLAINSPLLLESARFGVKFQPIVARNRRLVAAESLLRYTSAAGLAIKPTDAIAAARQANQIEHLANQVIEATCQARASWKVPATFLSSFNLSGDQLTAEVVANFRRALIRHNQSPRSFLVEITEGTPMTATAVRAVLDLHELGSQIWLDDFGRGYSSLTRLLELPIAGVKVDADMVAQIDDRHVQVVLEHLLRMVRKMELGLVCEGVETQQQLIRLRQWGADWVQGHIHSPAVSASQFLCAVK